METGGLNMMMVKKPSLYRLILEIIDSMVGFYIVISIY